MPRCTSSLPVSPGNGLAYPSGPAFVAGPDGHPAHTSASADHTSRT